MIRQYLPKSIEELILWYERYIAPYALLAGFIADNVFFRAINLSATTLALALYLSLALVGIFVVNIVETGRVRHPVVLKIAPFFPVIVQFSFGGMFSGFFVLYSQSATIAVSWISVAILAVLLVGNERFRRRYMRFSFQVGVLFVALLGYLTFLVPFALKRIGPEMFIGSSILALLLIVGFLYAMKRVMPELVGEHLTRIAKSVAIIFVTFNVLYFMNAIPPLPLALRDSGVYHGVVRDGDTYRVKSERSAWYQKYVPLPDVFHRAPGESVYVYTAIFAPAGLTTNMYHEWQHHDPATGDWNTLSKVSFPIHGGRDGGYRGYSFSSNLLPGRWRVNVETRSGQVVGRVSFFVESVEEVVPLDERVL